MLELVVDSNYNGPSLQELAPVLANVEGTVNVRWTNTREERVLLDSNRARNFKLFVVDPAMMERTASALGLRYSFDLKTREQAKLVLANRKNYNWRQFIDDVGPTVCRSIITRIASDAARQGVKPKLANIARECLLEGISVIDADVLLRLSYLRGE